MLWSITLTFVETPCQHRFLWMSSMSDWFVFFFLNSSNTLRRYHVDSRNIRIEDTTNNTYVNTCNQFAISHVLFRILFPSHIIDKCQRLVVPYSYKLILFQEICGPFYALRQMKFINKILEAMIVVQGARSSWPRSIQKAYSSFANYEDHHDSQEHIFD